MVRTLILLFLCLCLVTRTNAQSPLASLPMEINHGLCFIPVRVNSSDTLYFMFDTGAGATLIDNAAAEKIGLKSSGTGFNRGSTGRIEVNVSKKNTVTVGNQSVSNLDLVMLPLGHFDAVFGRHIDGIIGYDIFKNFVVELDHDFRKLNLYSFHDFNYLGNAKPLKVQLKTHQIRTDVVLVSKKGERLKACLMIDSGSMSKCRLYGKFVKKNKLKDPAENYNYVYENGSTGDVVKNAIDSLQSIQLAGRTYANPMVVLCEVIPKVNESPDGLIGNEILMQNKVTIDYKRKQVFIAPNLNVVRTQ